MPSIRIPVESLKIGMYVVGVDRSWLQTPFLRHSFPLKHTAEIEALQDSGIREVTIDPSKGLSPDFPAQDAPTSVSVSADTPPTQPERTGKQLPTNATADTAAAEEYCTARGWYQKWSARVQSLFDSARGSGFIEVQAVKQVVEEMVGEVLEHGPAYFAVMSMRRNLPHLYEHGLSVCTLSLLTAHAFGYSRTSLQEIGLGALLHDVGFVRLPRNLFVSLRSLTPEQRRLYNSHPRQGVEMLRKSDDVDPVVLNIVDRHHNSLPLAQDNLGLESTTAELCRLVTIADEFDELTTGQGILQPMSPHMALKQLYHLYQPYPAYLNWVCQLVRVIGVYPLYSLVQLNTGERGIVTALTPGKAHKPVIRVIRGAKGEFRVQPQVIDLAEETNQNRAVHEMLDPVEFGIDVESLLKQVET